MTRLDRYGRRLMAVAFFTALIVCLGVALAPTPASSVDGGDKLHHALAFYALTLLGAAAYPARRALIPLALGLSAYGGLIEIVQPLAPFGRTRDVMDWLADNVGILFAVLPLLLAEWRNRWPANPQ